MRRLVLQGEHATGVSEARPCTDRSRDQGRAFSAQAWRESGSGVWLYGSLKSKVTIPQFFLF